MSQPTFSVPPDAEACFLRALGARLQRSEFERLSGAPGFEPPNTFSIEQLMRPWLDKRFPRSEHYDYEWTIYECGFEALESYTPAMRVYLSSLYMYCNKVRQWGITIESDYCYLMVRAALQESSGGRSLAALSLGFIEWLHDCVPADPGYDDYYCLLSWLMLRRVKDGKPDGQFHAVLARLLAKSYSAERVSELTVSDRGVSSWLELHRELPGHLDPGLDEKLVQVITGAATR